MRKPTAQQIRNILTFHLSGEDAAYDRATTKILALFAPKRKKRAKIEKTIVQVPTWAISYIFNGDKSDLSIEEIRQCDRFLAELNHIDHPTGSDYFTHRPAFGLACNVYDCAVTFKSQKTMSKTTYTVIVGNLGTTHTGTNKRAAMKEYRDYVDASIATHGIIKGEDVTLCANGEPIKEHQGNQENRA